MRWRLGTGKAESSPPYPPRDYEPAWLRRILTLKLDIDPWQYDKIEDYHEWCLMERLQRAREDGVEEARQEQRDELSPSGPRPQREW